MRIARGLFLCMCTALLAVPVHAQNLFDEKDCSIIISYTGDYGGPAEARVMGRINTYVQQNVAIHGRTERGSVGEGELCLILHDPKEADAAYNDIRKMIPARSTKAWTGVTRHGKSYKTQWPDD